MRSESKGTLYIVATPIGNLADITLRALDVLSRVDVVAAEDTRRSRQLLSAHGLSCSMLALHDHNEEKASAGIIARLQEGQRVALVSDAGTPLVSDPGYRLVNAVIAAGLEVVSIPGPSAVIAALAVAGLPTDRFLFEGFLPAKSAARKGVLQGLRSQAATLIFFESSHRVIATIDDMIAVLGADRPAAICRELTKKFETVLRGTLHELGQKLQEDSDQTRGEFVLVVGGAAESEEGNLTRAYELALQLRTHLSASKASQVAAKVYSVSRRDVYRELEGQD